MSDEKISQLADGSSPQTTDLFPIARSGANYSLTWAELKAASPAANDDTVYVAAPTGVAATDNAAIAAAITACPAGGVVQLQAGTYAIIDSGTTSSLALSKQITLRGRGGADILWTKTGTLLTVDHATADGISVSSHGVKLENFAIQNIHATAPTAGAGLKTVTGGGNSIRYGDNLSVRGFYYNVDHQAGSNWIMDPSFLSIDFVYCGLRIQNVDATDGGDMTVSGNFMTGPNNNSTTAIQWLTGGGFKGYGIKINNHNSKTCTVGISAELQDGVSTSDFLLSNSSIENCTWGFLLEHAGPLNTGTFGNVVISGNQFLTVGTDNTTAAVAVTAASAGKVSEVFVGGNVIHGGNISQMGVLFKNIDNATHGPNVYKNCSGFASSGTNTNITTVGAG